MYILGDITNLPLRTDSLDAVISLHTIYHVPLDEQAKAFEELYRVLKTGRSGVIVYTFSDAPMKRWATKPAKWWNLVRNSAFGNFVKQRILGRKPMLATPRAPKKDDTNGVPFYFHAHPLEWFRSKSWTFPIDIVVWRSVNVWFLRTYIQPQSLRQIPSLNHLRHRIDLPPSDGPIWAISDVHSEEIAMWF